MLTDAYEKAKKETKRTRERLIKNYGHACNLSPEQIEDFYIFKITYQKNIFKRFLALIREQFLINEFNMPTAKYCRSQYALFCERRFHLDINQNLIHPLSNFRKWWEIFMIIISLLVLAIMPFTTTFSLLTNISHVHKWQDYPRIMFDLICFFDIIINFRTAYYDNQRQINFNRDDIAWNYIKKFFTFDIISSLPPLYFTTNIYIYEYNHSLFYCNLIINKLKLFRLFSCLNYVNNLCGMKHVENYYTKIILICITGIVIFHWITCLCITISTVSISIYFTSFPINRSWMTTNNVWNSTTSMLYATAFFRTACIITNAEYDIIQHTIADQILVMILWVSSRLLYVCFVSLLIQISRSLTSSQTKYKEMVLQLMQYMHHKQLSAYTQNRLISYYEFRFQKSFFREQEILNTISGQLRQEILMLKCLKLVENVPFFKGLPESLLVRIVLALQLEIFLINDIILKAGTRGTSMYFIGTGTVATYTETGKEIYHLHDGQHFGEIELVMTESLRISSVIAIEPCELYRLDRKEFMQIIRPYPELFQSIENVAAERMQYIRAIDEKHKYFYNEKKINRQHML